MTQQTNAATVLQAAIEQGHIPGAIAISGNSNHREYIIISGVTAYPEPPKPYGATPNAHITPQAINKDTLYDLASLTKIVSTLPAILKLISDGHLNLDDKIGTFFSSAGWFKTPSIRDLSVKQLLTHNSGLSAWQPIFAQASTRETAIANLLQSDIVHPAGHYCYSDLGFMLLGLITERITGQRQDTFVQEHIFKPLGMKNTRYRPNGSPASNNIAATENCGWRNRTLQGDVHDENAYAMQGVAGHAGLFGTASDLATYAQAWLNHNPIIANKELMQTATQEHLNNQNVRRGLGFMLKHPDSSAGAFMSERAFGHTGFTGTSLWVDPARDFFAVLLTNRVHPSRTTFEGMQQLRREFHDALLHDGGTHATP